MLTPNMDFFIATSTDYYINTGSELLFVCISCFEHYSELNDTAISC